MIHPPETPEAVTALRADTAGCESVVHFNNAGSSLPPKRVVDRMVRHLRTEERIGGYEAADEVSAELDDVRGTLGALVGAGPDEIAVTDSASRSWLSVFTAVGWAEGDRILTGAAEYSSNIIAMLDLAHRRGVRVEVVPSTPEGELDVDALAATLDDDVRMVAVTHAPTNGGLLQPVERIGAVVADSPAFYLVDACQSVGQVPIDLRTLGADALSATGRKYLRAPRGTGFLAVRRGVLDTLHPAHLDLTSARIEDGSVRPRDDARRFELFEHNVAAVLGLGEAARYYRAVGPEWAHDRITALAEHLRVELGRIPGITVTDLGRHRSGIVSFSSERVPAPELVSRLRERGVHVSVSRAPSTPWDMADRRLDELVRASVHYYNTSDEIARLCRELAAMG
ncbi:aminotransferase class V-fold PLP-dependent enzyme [Saccharomonospora halophila]|uniref:aminotransferase class V-fold PLP-dependent enzyme n=1 Tax=Saccharomonospora halophila TaxID=129922 RepID=UPI0003803FDA|nr:aminotransferase class V-fold PLP-dependent enzyme [Saccharomonospora halophila]